MNAIVDRRLFLGSAAALGAGLAVINQAPRLLAQQRADTAQQQAGTASPDAGAAQTPMVKDWAITHITDEAARIARALQAQPRPEHMLALAANLRLFDRYAREHRIDERIGNGVAELVSTRGREAIIGDAASEQTAAHLRRMFEAEGVLPHLEKVPPAAYGLQLDAILQKTALSSILTEGARTLEMAYLAEQKKHGGGGAHVMRIQSSDLEQAFRCAHFARQCNYYAAQAEFYCAMAYFVAPAGIICAGMGLSAAGYCGASVYYGC
jgi:hypothetical protein